MIGQCYPRIWHNSVSSSPRIRRYKIVSPKRLWVRESMWKSINPLRSNPIWRTVPKLLQNWNWDAILANISAAQRPPPSAPKVYKGRVPDWSWKTDYDITPNSSPNFRGEGQKVRNVASIFRPQSPLMHSRFRNEATHRKCKTYFGAPIIDLYSLLIWHSSVPQLPE